MRWQLLSPPPAFRLGPATTTPTALTQHTLWRCRAGPWPAMPPITKEAWDTAATAANSRAKNAAAIAISFSRFADNQEPIPMGCATQQLGTGVFMSGATPCTLFAISLCFFSPHLFSSSPSSGVLLLIYSAAANTRAALWSLPAMLPIEVSP